MDIEGLANSLNGYLSIYGIRFLVISSTLLFVIAWFVIWKFFAKSVILKVIYLSLLFLTIVALSIIPFLVYNLSFIREHFVTAFITLLPLWFLFCGFLFHFLSHRMYESKSMEGKKVFKTSSFVSIILTIFALLFVLFVSLFARPYVTLAGLEEETVIREDSTFKMKLTVPVLKNGLDVSVFPEQKIDLVYDYVAGSKEWIDGFEIIPTENYPAESRIVVYVVGLTNIMPGGSKHEQSLEFFAPSLPAIQSSNLDKLEGDVNVETDLEFMLDKKNQESAKWNFEINPAVEYETVFEENKIKLNFIHLSQGTTYSVKAFRSNRIYNTITKEEVRVDNQVVAKELTFKTIDPPQIKGYNWKNTSLANTEPLVVDFTDRINLEMFANQYKIEPNISHTISIGSNGTSFILKPNGAFAKDTSYTVTFLKGLKTDKGGFFESDVIVPFKTAGVVKAIAFSPRNGISGVKKTIKSVSVIFDQRVDHSSAEARFSFSPAIPGTFSWSGNTMIYTLAAELDFYTRYTISVGAGVGSVYGLDSNQAFSSAFTTEEQVIILPVPQFYQPKGFDCNLYASKMALAFRGVSISVDGAKASIGMGQDPNASWVDQYGTHWGPLSRFIGGYRANSIRAGWNVAGLATEVANGNPSIVYVYNGRSTPYGAFELSGGYTGFMGMHSEVVVGFTGRPDNPTSIITNDPWRGRRKYSIGSFLGVWGYLGNRAIVVY